MEINKFIVINKNESLTTVIHLENDCYIFVFNDTDEHIIMIGSNENLPELFRINKNQRNKNISITEIESESIKEHIDFYLKLIFFLLKAGRDFKYINDFIKEEIL